jgi:hypothetical protein
MTIDFKGFFRNKNHRQRKINNLERLKSRRWVNVSKQLVQLTLHNKNVTGGFGRDRNVAHACFRPITSSVSVVSDFVANGYQAMQHVSTSPPTIPESQISRFRF